MRAKDVVMVPCVCLVWSVWAIVAAHAQEINAELTKFQGTWVMISAEMDGRQVEDTHVQSSKITFVGNKVELIAPHQHKDTIVATITKIDETKNPKEMVWVRSAGPHAGATTTAIYAFEGPDTYRICFDPAGSAAPKQFGTKKGSGHIWHTWKRVTQ